MANEITISSSIVWGGQNIYLPRSLELDQTTADLFETVEAITTSEEDFLDTTVSGLTAVGRFWLQNIGEFSIQWGPKVSGVMFAGYRLLPGDGAWARGRSGITLRGKTVPFYHGAVAGTSYLRILAFDG